jgi:fucose permease
VLVVLVFAAFVSIGLPDAIFGTAWPSMRREFSMGNAAVGYLNIPGALVYIASSATLGTLLRRLGVARLLSISTILVAIGLTIYASAPSFWVIIPAVMLISVGSGAIDAALNLFAAERLPTRYMSWLHAFYGIGALIGPFIMAIVFSLGHSWRWGYAVIAMALWIMAAVFMLTHSHWQADARASANSEMEPALSGRQVLRMPRVRLSMVMFAMGAICESLASLWIASLLLQRFGVSESQASIGAGVYWAGLTAARVMVPVLWPQATPFRVQRGSTYLLIAAAAMMIPAWLPSAWLGIALLGLAAASLFPAAMSITSIRFGKAISTHAVGYQISASTAMFAIMPTISGWIADRTSMAAIPVIILLAGLALLITQLMLSRGDEPEDVT